MEEKVSLMKRHQDGQQQAEEKKTAKIRQVVHENRQLTFRSTAQQANITEKQLGKS